MKNQIIMNSSKWRIDWKMVVVVSFLSLNGSLFAQKSEEINKVIFQDDFTRISSWEVYKADGAEIKVVSSKKDENIYALKIDYNLYTKDWVAVEKKVNLVLKENNALKLKVFSSGKNNYLEIKFVDKDGSIFGNKMILSSDSPQDILLQLDEFEYWWGGDDKLDNVVRIGFAISKKEGGKGVVEISDLKIIEVPKKVKQLPQGVLDDFETKKRWTMYTSEKASLILKNLPGKEGNSLVAEYDLGEEEGQWVAFEKRFNMDFSKNKTIKFWVKAEGEVNKLEFKVIDEDGSIFGQRYEDLTNSWQEIKIPVDQLEYWWDGDDILSKPVKVGFAISSIDGGKGKIWLDNLRLTK